MRALKVTIAYDGTEYAGWQVQPGQGTIQLALEQALRKITGESMRATASGRTDAGVHALGQVVGFLTASSLQGERLVGALNAELPDDIAVLAVDEAPQDFHPIRDAISKKYRYVIHNGRVRDVFARRYAWHYPSRIDEQAMARAAEGLVGKHDFQSFQSSGAPRESTVRTVTQLSVRRGQGEADRVEIEIEADGFLYNMVRAIVGTLVEVGRGAQPETWPAEVLAACDRSAAGPTAPPQGLFLVNVHYGF